MRRMSVCPVCARPSQEKVLSEPAMVQLSCGHVVHEGKVK
jgi:hypothetical protein